MPRLSALGATWAAAATVASPGLRLMLRMRLARGKELPGRLRERRGIDPTPRPPGRLIWLHALPVSARPSLILPVLPDARRTCNGSAHHRHRGRRPGCWPNASMPAWRSG